MGLIHKTKFVPFLDISKTDTPNWKQIKKSTTFSMSLNPQTKTFDFISSENPQEEIDSYQPSLSQSLTMYDDEPDFKAIFDMVFNLPTGGDAHRNVLLCFYATKYALRTYEESEDTTVEAGKKYFTRSGSEGAYVYTEVAEPTGSPVENNYYEIATETMYYAAWKVDSVVKLGTLDSVNQSIDFDLALNEHITGAVTLNDGQPTWVAGAWYDGVFVPAA